MSIEIERLKGDLLDLVRQLIKLQKEKGNWSKLYNERISQVEKNIEKTLAQIESHEKGLPLFYREKKE